METTPGIRNYALKAVFFFVAGNFMLALFAVTFLRGMQFQGIGETLDAVLHYFIAFNALAAAGLVYLRGRHMLWIR